MCAMLYDLDLVLHSAYQLYILFKSRLQFSKPPPITSDSMMIAMLFVKDRLTFMLEQDASYAQIAKVRV